MSANTSTKTSSTLLRAIANSSDKQAWNDAWARFVERYGPSIYAWAARRVSYSDAEDVTQEVLLNVRNGLRTYDRDRKFRSWLKTVVVNAIASFRRSRKNRQLGSGDETIADRLDSEPPRRDLLEQLKEVFDLEVVEEAKARVKEELPKAWLVFELKSEQGKSTQEVAVATGLSRAAVIKNDYRVRTRLREVIEELNRDDDAGGDQPCPDAPPGKSCSAG